MAVQPGSQLVIIFRFVTVVTGLKKGTPNVAIYMLEVAYTPETWAAMVRKPQNRVEAIRPAIEALGGRILNAFFSFGEFDVVLILEYPDEVSAAAFQVAAAAGGAARATRTTPLMSIEDGVTAFKKAGTITYLPPSRG